MSPELQPLGGETPLAAASFGGKAAWLDRALRAGENVPAGLALSAHFAHSVAAGDAGAQAALARAIEGLLHAAEQAGATLAVRSSPTRSVPGALLTRLAVAPEPSQVLCALREVLASAELPHVAAQLSAQTSALPLEPWVAVLIQCELAFPEAGDVGAVVFTHDPRTGQPGLRGEYAPFGPRAVVSGRGHPLPLAAEGAARSLRREDPVAMQAIEALVARLTALFAEPLELELGVAGGVLSLLQVRALTLTPRALVRVALAAIDADSPHYDHWLNQLADRGLTTLVEAHFAEGTLSACPSLMRGLAASPGAAVGVAVMDVERAIARAREEPVVLLRPDALPEDVAAFRVAAAIVTSSGGLTCHAAVIARGLGVPALVGVTGVRIDAARGLVLGGRDTRETVLREGDWVSVDARRGSLHRGRAQLEPHVRDPELKRLFAEVRKLRPTPLWVHGEVESALRIKDEAALDGALCPWPDAGALPEAVGRECWVEIDATSVAARLPTLPRGWGIVISGDLRAVELASLRALAPLRAFGVRLERADDVPPEGALDLLVVAFAGDVPAQKRAMAPRLLRVMSFPERAPVPGGNNVGWLCPASHVALTALRYAALRTKHTVISLAEEGEP